MPHPLRAELFLIFEEINVSTYAEKVLWLEKLVDWLRKDTAETSEKLQYFFYFLAIHPELKRQSAQLVVSVLYDRPAVRLFSEMGVPSWTSITQELSSRLGNLFIPPYSDHPEDLENALPQVFHEKNDFSWLAQFSNQEQHEIVNWLSYGIRSQPLFEIHFLNELLDAALILTVKSAAITIRNDFSKRCPQSTRLLQNPLFHIQEKIAFLRKNGNSRSLPELEYLELGLKQFILDAEQIADFVKQQLEENGVSVDLVFQRDRLNLYLDRLELLTEGIFSILKSAPERSSVSWRIFLTLVQGNSNDRDLSSLIRANASLFCKKIVDMTSSRGFSYIAQTPEQYRKMFYLAAGGGAITAFTVLIKYSVQSEGWPLFIEFFYAFLNYSLSFIVMDLFHFKLATKQPGLTAAALASKMENNRRGDGVMIEEFAKVTRTQFAAVLGNLVAVIPVSLLLDFCWDTWKGQTFMDAPQALHVIENLHPCQTGTILFAAMTGLLLWLSGVTAGWIENAFLFHQLPERIRTHRGLRQIFGMERTERWSIVLQNHLSGIASAVSLGAYLALWPMLGKFFGLPLEVRHITLTTGSVTLAIHTLGISALTLGNWVTLITSIALVGWMNFTVSFGLSMLVAIQAKGLNFERSKSLFKITFEEFIRHPLRFLLSKDVNKSHQ